MTQATKRKAKRKLSDISFEQEGAHIALVSKTQGGPAHGADYAIIIKGRNFSEEFLQKMQQIRVTMELPEFLERFMGVYGMQAEMLARMMGYVPEEDEDMDEPVSYEEYIQEKMQAFEIIKAASEAKSLAEVLSAITEEEYLAVLTDQQLLEKALLEIESNLEGNANAVNSGDDTSIAGEVNKLEGSSPETTTLEKSMDETTTVEVVEKSVLESVQKSLDDTKAELQKALDTLAQFEAEKKEAIAKAKTAQLAAVVKNEKHLEILAKAALVLEGEDFTSFVGAITELHKQADESELFLEKGATVSDEAKASGESAVAKILKAKQSK